MEFSGCIRVYKGIWRAIIYWEEGGKRRQKQFSTGLPERGNKRKAEKFLKEKLDEFKNVYESTEQPLYALERREIPFDKYAKQWLKNTKGSIRGSTYESYRAKIDSYIIPFFGATKLCAINKQRVQEFYNYLRDDLKLASSTIYNTHSVLSLIMYNAVDDDMILKNPCNRTKRPKVCVKEHNFYSIDECQKLFAAFEGDAMLPMLQITVTLGLRRSEAIGLRWSAIDFDAKTISITHTVVQAQNRVFAEDRTKSETSRRTFVMFPEIEKILLNLKKNENYYRNFFGNVYNENDYVFKWPNGVCFRPEYVTLHLEKVIKKNGLRPIRFHDLRHSCASILYSLGYGVKEIQMWLGHSSPDITLKTYTHLFDQAKLDTGRVLCGAMLGTCSDEVQQGSTEVQQKRKKTV